MNLKKELKKHFGFDKFRPLQQKVVKSVVDGNDTLMVVSTGTGKSLCYQLPGMIMDGITIVISPLISLMQDQVSGLQKRGVGAELIAAYMTAEDAQRVYRDAIGGKIGFLFVSPERAVTEKFMQFMDKLDVRNFAIDEAHCIVQWGEDFRDSYKKLGNLKERYPAATVSAFTASASDKTRNSIIKSLNMHEPTIVVGSSYRKNIKIQVEERKKSGYPRLMGLIKKHKKGSGIVYAFSRKDVDRIAKELKKRKVSCLGYHAGMSDTRRSEVMEKFMSGKTKVVVATVAFGMGIDKADVRFVCHMHIPRSMDSYYQEIGRAGRDGKASEAVLLFSYADIKKIEWLIDKDKESKVTAENQQQLNIMSDYAYSFNCRHKTVGKYFGDNVKDCKTKCDNCG